MNGRPWVPILEGDTAARARAAVERVAASVAGLQPGRHAYGPSAAGGDAGFAILFAELSQCGRTGAGDLATEYLGAAMTAVATTPLAPSLYSGFLSVAWSLTLLESTGLQPKDETATAEIDAALLDHLRTTPWRRDYDLISGLVGYGVYALARHPTPFSAEASRLIVDRLAELATRRNGAITWFTPPELLPVHQRTQNPDGLYNVGLAHGVPGVVALLGQMSAAGAGGDQARTLLEGALSWLDQQRLPVGSVSAFPAQIGAASPGPCRLAWCYGDAGVAAAMLAASAGVPAARDTAVQLLLHAADRPRDACGVRDAGLCHGAAGLGLMFLRFYQATGVERFREAAVAWFEDALDRSAPDDELGGFPSSRRDGFEPDPGLLTGSAGVALALLAALEPREPRWDQLLLLSSATPERSVDPATR